MSFKHVKTERSMEARRRLAEQSPRRPSQKTHPPGNAAVDRRDLERSLERFEALVGH